MYKIQHKQKESFPGHKESLPNCKFQYIYAKIVLFNHKQERKQFRFSQKSELKNNDMNVTGIIAEYNPIHKGHLHQITECRKNGADCIVAVMSGDFVQRGCPAILNKYVRTKMALLSGVDLVIELPSLYATASASGFAEGGIALLENLGCISSISFGCETPDLEKMEKAASFLADPDAGFQNDCRSFQSRGYSFPKARELALSSRFGEEIPAVFKSPNNILALEYLTALKRRHSAIRPFPILREGLDYHEQNLDFQAFPSSTALRKSMEACIQAENSKDSNNYSLHRQEIRESVKEEVFQYLTDQQLLKDMINFDDFSLPLHCKLLTESADSLSEYLDVSKDLACKIVHHLAEFQNCSQFCELLKSRDITYTRISRCLLHILLNIRKQDWEQCKKEKEPPYARILGFRQSASPLLTEIKKTATVPVISKLADAKNCLSPCGKQMLEQSVLHSDLYSSVAFHKTGRPFLSEYRRQLVILP